MLVWSLQALVSEGETANSLFQIQTVLSDSGLTKEAWLCGASPLGFPFRTLASQLPSMQIILSIYPAFH